MFSNFTAYTGLSRLTHADATRSATAQSISRYEKTTSTPSTKASDDKPFAKVAADARKFLNAGYQKLGRVADARTTEQDWRDAVQIQNLDRRALYAIASNHGGLFSEAESNAAKSEITALGTRAVHAANPRGTDPAAAAKASIDLLDRVSPEEKASLAWAQSRASAQVTYLGLIKERHQVRATSSVETHDPVVNLFVKAGKEFAAAQSSGHYGPTIAIADMPSWSKGVSLWNRLHEPQSKTLGRL